MKSAKSVAFWGMLCATAAALSFLESLLPVLPFLPPGAKAGFSNIITLFSAGYCGLFPTLAISVVKSLFVLLTRGGMACAMSLAGGLLSSFAMWLCLKQKASLLATGIIGALCHNTAQLCVASAITATPALWYYSPFLLLFALLAGSVTGCLLKTLYPPLSQIGNRMIAPKKRG